MVSWNNSSASPPVTPEVSESETTSCWRDKLGQLQTTCRYIWRFISQGYLGIIITYKPVMNIARRNFNGCDSFSFVAVKCQGVVSHLVVAQTRSRHPRHITHLVNAASLVVKREPVLCKLLYRITPNRSTGRSLIYDNHKI